MKFLENSRLEWLSSVLSVETSEYRLETRIESYSCKMVGQDKRLFKGLLQADGPGTTANDLQALSPPVVDEMCIFSKSGSPNFSLFAATSGRHSRSHSGGSDQEMEADSLPLCDTVSRKTLYCLVATLNASFSDYDFTDAKGENFSKLPSLDYVTGCVDSKLSAIINGYNKLKHQLWASLDEEIHLKDSLLYTYHPDYHSDPYSEDGCTWSYNYFFYNKKLKRILFFTCRALSSILSNTADDSSVSHV